MAAPGQQFADWTTLKGISEAAGMQNPLAMLIGKGIEKLGGSGVPPPQEQVPQQGSMVQAAVPNSMPTQTTQQVNPNAPLPASVAPITMPTLQQIGQNLQKRNPMIGSYSNYMFGE
jgi:hypothetical protein